MQKNKTIEERYKIYCGNGGIHFYDKEEITYESMGKLLTLEEFISKERKQWEESLITELNSRRFCRVGELCKKDDKRHDKMIDEFISLLESKEECDCHRHCKNRKCGIKSFNHVTKPCEKYNVK